MEVLLCLVVLAGPQLLATFSIFAGVIHTAEELGAAGVRPIWEYLGITENPITGSLLLVGFILCQFALALAGFIDGSAAALVALAAIRLLDFGVSHLGPWLAGKRPNPGILSAPLYLIDAAFIGAVLAR